jgi:hypothetical protein
MTTDATRYTKDWCTAPGVTSLTASMTPGARGPLPRETYSRTNHVKITMAHGHDALLFRDGRLALLCPLGAIPEQDFMFAISGEVPCTECMSLVAAYRGKPTYWQFTGTLARCLDAGWPVLHERRKREDARGQLSIPAWDTKRQKPNLDAWLSTLEEAQWFVDALVANARRSVRRPRSWLVNKGRTLHAITHLPWHRTDFDGAHVSADLTEMPTPFAKAECSKRAFRAARKYVTLLVNKSWYMRVFARMGGVVLDTQRHTDIVVMGIEETMADGALRVYALKASSPFGSSHVRRCIIEETDDGTGTMRWTLRKWIIGPKGVV